ncbi:MAG: GntR family transcriptional regulator [Actinomycetota bacterium]
MPVRVDRGSDIAAFEQIRAGVVAAIDAGELAPGDRLPTVRGLAGELEVAPNTVAKAYRELEADGVVETRGRQGTRIALDADATHRAAVAAARAYVERVTELGLEPAEALGLVTRALDAGGGALTRSR